MSDLLYPCVRYLIAPAWAAWERSPYLRHQRHLRRTEWDDPASIADRQWRQLVPLLQHAAETSTFWRQRFAACGLDPARCRDWDDFRRLTPLTKTELRTRRDELVSNRYDRSTLHYHTTSGSTGESVGVYVDDPAQQWRRATTLRSDEWTGWRLGEKVALVWGNPEYQQRGWRGRLRNGLLDRASYLDTLKMDEAAMGRFLEVQRRRRPTLMMGHAHSLYLLAEFARARGGAGFRPRGIISTAMALHDWQRTSIESVFGCPVTNRYGCEEVALIACECSAHDGLHVNADGVYVELVRPDGEPAAPGEPGSVLVTDLSNRAMPILRYQVGDVAVWAEGRCPCGRGLPRLARLEGREADYVVTPAGELVSGISLTENFAMQIPGLAQLQIVQEAVDQFLFCIVKAADFGPESEARIAELVRERFGPEVRYACEFVARIPQERSGKYRFCISKVPNPFLASRELVTT